MVMMECWKSRWISRLRDPASRQWFGKLSRVDHHGECYCVIGHLLDLCVEAGIATKERVGEGFTWLGTRMYERTHAAGQFADLWRQIREETGFDYMLWARELVRMNDTERKTLREISEFIEVAV